jgi:diguanylate cyclase (GGDEF)-like protein
LTVRARVGVSVAAMLLPLLAVSGAAVFALDGTLDRFADTADEALEDALPLARLQTLVLGVERSGLSAAPTPLGSADREDYQLARTQLQEAFADLEEEDLTEEGDLVASAHRSADRAVQALNETLNRSPAVDEPPAFVSRMVASQRHTEAAVRDLREAEQLSEVDIVEEYQDAQQIQRGAIATIVAVVLTGLVLAFAGGIHLVRSVLGPLRSLREAASRLGEGTLSHRVALPHRDEFGELGEAFNVMAGDLERSRDDLAHHGLHDALTGLPNRVLLGDRTSQALARSSRHRKQVALLLIDLDGFKAVNDSLGHSVGDEVLRSAADRLRLCLRPEDTAARLGGDEFAVLVEADIPAQALGVGERILRSMRPAFTHAGTELFVTASIGVAFATPDHESTGEDLLRDADLAMYRAKRDGKDGLCVYDRTMHDDAEDRLRLDGELRGALGRGELLLHYQPIYGIDGHPLLAVVALMRWNHPTRGFIPPLEFIPIAETSGLIITLGTWALNEACRQLRNWQDTAEDGAADDLQLSVNLSARQLNDDNLPALVASTLARHDIAPQRLILEITESMMIGDVPGTIRRLRELKALGVQLAIDDFGTGYSSLGYLQQFPIDRIKIDKSFVDQLDTAEGKALAEGIINLARSLALDTIAEGIEHEHQRRAMDDLGCRLGQGYHFARPEGPDHIARRLASPVRETPFPSPA